MVITIVLCAVAITHVCFLTWIVYQLLSTRSSTLEDFVIYLLLKLKKGGDMMMAMFFAQRVILGKTTFDKVPKALKKGVAEVLIDSGLPELVPSEFGGTADLPAA